MGIRIDNLAGAAVPVLLRKRLQDMLLHSSPECIHSLDRDRYENPNLTPGVSGRGVPKTLDGQREEKSMHGCSTSDSASPHNCFKTSLPKLRRFASGGPVWRQVLGTPSHRLVNFTLTWVLLFGLCATSV